MVDNVSVVANFFYFKNRGFLDIFFYQFINGLLQVIILCSVAKEIAAGLEDMKDFICLPDTVNGGAAAVLQYLKGANLKYF